MRFNLSQNRFIVIISLICYSFMLIAPAITKAQSEYCIYDRKAPSVESARESFRNKDYECTNWELNDLLALKKIQPEFKADALILLAQVNYQIIQDNQEKRSTVRKNLITAFRTYPAWSGELEIRSTEFFNLISDSRDIAQRLGPLPADTDVDETEIDEITEFKETEKKPWYKKWWIFGTGVSVMALAAVLIAGNDDKTENAIVLDTLADFPSSPGKQNK